MTQQDALYRAVCAFPDEDTPRLLFADWLEDSGDPRRASFIRTQVELARVPEHDPLWARCRRRDPNAIRGWAMAHTLPQLPAGFSWRSFRFHRGFPWLASLTSLDNWSERAEQLFEAAPIQALELDPDCGIAKRMSEFAECPHLAKLTRLQFDRTRFGTTEMKLLGNSPFAANLSELCLEGHAIEAEGLAALVESPLFTRLKRFELHRAALPPMLAMDAFGDVHSNLRSLSISDCKFPAPDVAHMLGLPFVQRVTSLDVSNNPLHSEFVESLAASFVLAGLEHLDLSATDPGMSGIRKLAKSESLGNLRRLNLAGNRLGPSAIRALCEAEDLSGLRMLDLSRNPIGASGARILAECPHLESLVELDVRGCELEATSLRILSERISSHCAA